VSATAGTCKHCKGVGSVNFYGTDCCSFDCYDEWQKSREQSLLWAIRQYRGDLTSAADAMAPYVALSAYRDQLYRRANGPLDIVGLKEFAEVKG